MTQPPGADLAASITQQQIFTLVLPLGLLLFLIFAAEEVMARAGEPVPEALRNIAVWMKRRIVGIRMTFLALLAGFYAYQAVWWYNMDMSELNNMAMSRAQVGKEFQRREDLAANLDNIVNNYANHEKVLFEHVSDMRAQLMSIEAGGGRPTAAQRLRLEHAFMGLMAIAEQYPNLKAEQRFHDLMDMAEITENRIAGKLDEYLEAILEYNTCNQHFWCNYWTFFPVAQLVPMPSFFEYYHSQSDRAPAVPPADEEAASSAPQ